MDILEKAELQRCFYNDKETPPTVEIRKLEKEYTEELIFRRNEIVFMTEGKVRFIFRGHPEKTLSTGEFIFVPMGGVFRFVVVENTQVTVIRLNGNVNLCGSCRIEDLYRRSDPALDNNKDVFALTINHPLQLFLEGLNKAVQGGLNCRYYFDIKAKEILILLKAYYLHEQLSLFFSPILSPDTIFSEYVRAHHHKYATARELADAMYMTPKLFSKKFIAIFGEPATDWLRREKALNVYSELIVGNEAIAQIAYKYNFSSQSHLNRFCKKEFGENPGKIRKAR